MTVYSVWGIVAEVGCFWRSVRPYYDFDGRVMLMIYREPMDGGTERSHELCCKML